MRLLKKCVSWENVLFLSTQLSFDVPPYQVECNYSCTVKAENNIQSFQNNTRDLREFDFLFRIVNVTCLNTLGYKQNHTHVHEQMALRKKATIHQVTTMLATSKNVLFPGHNHLLTTGIEDPSFAGARAIIKVSGHQYWWLGPRNRTFLEVASMVVTWWIVVF